MLDIRVIREQPDMVRAGLERRGVAHVLDDVLAADERYRKLTKLIEDKRHEQREASKKVGGASPEDRPALLEAARGVKGELDALEPELEAAKEQLEMLMAGLPNLPHPTAADGTSDDDNVV